MNNENVMIQNLKDAGCDSHTVKTFIEDLRTNKIADGLKLLTIQKQTLLDELHKEQKQIKCLDYLVYKMEKTNKKMYDSIKERSYFI